MPRAIAMPMPPSPPVIRYTPRSRSSGRASAAPVSCPGGIGSKAGSQRRTPRQATRVSPGSADSSPSTWSAAALACAGVVGWHTSTCRQDTWDSSSGITLHGPASTARSGRIRSTPDTLQVPAVTTSRSHCSAALLPSALASHSSE